MYKFDIKCDVNVSPILSKLRHVTNVHIQIYGRKNTNNFVFYDIIYINYICIALFWENFKMPQRMFNLASTSSNWKYIELKFQQNILSDGLSINIKKIYPFSCTLFHCQWFLNYDFQWCRKVKSSWNIKYQIHCSKLITTV